MIVNKHKDHPSLPINTFSSSPPSSRLQRLQTLFYHLLFIPFPKAWTDAAHVGDFFNFLPFCLSSLARTIERERETAKANNSRPARACEAKGWEFSCMHPHTHTNEISTKSSSLHPSISCKTECVSPPPLSLSLSSVANDQGTAATSTHPKHSRNHQAPRFQSKSAAAHSQRRFTQLSLSHLPA